VLSGSGGELTIGSEKVPFRRRHGDLHPRGSASRGEVFVGPDKTIMLQPLRTRGSEQRFKAFKPAAPRRSSPPRKGPTP